MLDGLQKIRVAGRPCRCHSAMAIPRAAHRMVRAHLTNSAKKQTAGAKGAAGKPWAGKAAGAKPFGKKTLVASHMGRTTHGWQQTVRQAGIRRASVRCQMEHRQTGAKAMGQIGIRGNAGMTTQEKFRANLKKSSAESPKAKPDGSPSAGITIGLPETESPLRFYLSWLAGCQTIGNDAIGQQTCQAEPIKPRLAGSGMYLKAAPSAVLAGTSIPWFPRRSC